MGRRRPDGPIIPVWRFITNYISFVMKREEEDKREERSNFERSILENEPP
jgi:hypothetical protein